MATLPATAAMTAEMAGAAAARFRAVSRRAIRGATGSQRPNREIRPTRAGVQTTSPSSLTTAPASITLAETFQAP